MPTTYHVTARANRASIEEHGLDWTRMGPHRGVAGSTRPEVDGVFLCRDEAELEFFLHMAGSRGPADVWIVAGVDPGDLLIAPEGFAYLPRPVPPGQLTLRPAVLTLRPAVPARAPQRVDPADGAYGSTLTITLDDGRVLRDAEARAYVLPSATVEKDGRVWRVGTAQDVAWIRDGTTPGLAITAGIPPVFEAYGTVLIPDDDRARPVADTALLDQLGAVSTPQPWLLGYLDTGAHDVVFPGAAMVTLYTDWRYVLIEAGPDQAGAWRADNPWRGRLPDLVFPADHSWLVSMLWDDDWRCVGGSDELLRRLVADPRLPARRVEVDEVATPPGFTAR